MSDPRCPLPPPFFAPSPPPPLLLSLLPHPLLQVHHPDVAGEGDAARENFAAILVAYTCLRDHSARYHYDLHGFPLDKLLERRQEEESIYSWEPKYSVYSEPMTVDGETTEVGTAPAPPPPALWPGIFIFPSETKFEPCFSWRTGS